MNINTIVKGLESATKGARLVDAALKGRLPQHLANKEIAKIKGKIVGKATNKLWF